MKRLIGSGLILIVVAVNLTICATTKDNTPELGLNYEFPLLPDTTTGNPFFKVFPFRLTIMPPSLGIQFYRDGIVFLSNTKTEANLVPDHVSFGRTEAYYAKLADTVLVGRSLFSSSSPFTFPCEAMTFNSDYSIMYFSKLPQNRGSEKIYHAQYITDKNGKGAWKIDNQPLNFCIDPSAYTHPALSANGEMMVLASNKKPSEGKFDLFLTLREGLGWSKPENLGNQINTNGNELFPFLDSENNLFFSSDGHKGLGGYDLYFCRYNGKGWDKPANLSEYINSANDELAFTINPNDGKSAFFTTRQKSGKQSMQLFRVTFNDQSALKEVTDLSKAFAWMIPPDKPSAEIIAASTIPVPTDLPKTEPVIEPLKQEDPVKEVKADVVPVKPQAEPAVVYRVQFIANSKPKGSYKITINGVAFDTYEYLYSGLYRTCAGEFSNVNQARNLQNLMRKEGHSEAFVVAFKNNERSLDLALFK